MKNKEFMMLQLFAAEEGTTTAADLAPAISVDFTSRIARNHRSDPDGGWNRYQNLQVDSR